MLIDKVERDLNRQEKSIIFSVPRGTVELQSMRELARRQGNQSKEAEAEIVKSHYRWQIVKLNRKRKAETEASRFLSKH
jgi:hypothetical protein